MENRKTSNWVFMTGFVLWDIILTDEEILKSTKTCDGTNGNPVVKWEDFYPLAESNAAITKNLYHSGDETQTYNRNNRKRTFRCDDIRYTSRQHFNASYLTQDHKEPLSLRR
ncbi:hypothetical protein pdam_00020689 [Pocillopora damicornis]|uniref:Uncharacterized protein n=1 Tax=Pocillopora damicornis TaxID=46731 RepID=A0A3M6UWC5_POCDA|nr:hypothetical protein pdam_00020689 [Pocillopora damicornis]